MTGTITDLLVTVFDRNFNKLVITATDVDASDLIRFRTNALQLVDPDKMAGGHFSE